MGRYSRQTLARHTAARLPSRKGHSGPICRQQTHLKAGQLAGHEAEQVGGLGHRVHPRSIVPAGRTGQGHAVRGEHALAARTAGCGVMQRHRGGSHGKQLARAPPLGASPCASQPASPAHQPFGSSPLSTHRPLLSNTGQAALSASRRTVYLLGGGATLPAVSAGSQASQPCIVEQPPCKPMLPLPLRAQPTQAPSPKAAARICSAASPGGHIGAVNKESDAPAAGSAVWVGRRRWGWHANRAGLHTQRFRHIACCPFTQACMHARRAASRTSPDLRPSPEPLGLVVSHQQPARREQALRCKRAAAGMCVWASAACGPPAE